MPFGLSASWHCDLPHRSRSQLARHSGQCVDLGFHLVTAIYFDIPLDDDKRRQGLYDGALYVYSPTQSTREFASFAHGMITEAFGDDDPETVQDRMAVEEYAEVLEEA